MQKNIYKLPQDFIEKIKKIYPQKYHFILKTFLVKKEPCFRANLIKINLEEFIRKLKAENIRFQRIPWYNEIFILKHPPQREFQKTSLYQKGFVYLQNPSSALPVLVLNPQKEEKILDLCAAPGSKTSQIASLTQQKSEITAVEKIKPRFYKLQANLRILGITKVKTILADGSFVWKKYPEYFDKVLVDAPCSSEAQFRVNFPKTFSYWSKRKVKEQQRKQKRLIFSGIKALKPGGILVYSTCTFSPEENEEVINWALMKFPKQIRLQEIKIPFPNYACGLTQWQGKTFSKQLTLARRIIPDNITEGFFIAKLQKTG